MDAFQSLMTAVDLLRRGGFVMVPLGFCSLASVAIMIERFAALRRAAVDTDTLMGDLRARIERDDVAGALRLCESTPGPVARVLAAGLAVAPRDAAGIERRLEELALAETPELHKRLVWLDTIITISPLLGLLGTVIGMIASFRVIGVSGESHPAAITAGVAEALIATATGLTIAIVTLVGYNALTDRVSTVISTMELRATQLLNLLADRQERIASDPLPGPAGEVQP